ncbi:putative AMP-dependent synthetase/ligase, AMP-binding, ANL domain-containing protein [Helianthus debilis subsp. tardiflorus]
MTGAVINTINTRLDACTVSIILRHSESKLVFVDYQLTSLILEAVSLLPEEQTHPQLILITDDGSPSSVINSFVNSYETMVEAGDQEFKWVRLETDWDSLSLNYTSGTTSSPKGVVHSHRGTYIGAVSSLLEWFVPKQPVYLWTLPMFHAKGGVTFGVWWLLVPPMCVYVDLMRL